MTREQIEAIIAGCKGVTPGPWFASGVRTSIGGADWHWINRYLEQEKRDQNLALVSYDKKTGEGFLDSKHIARCDPDTVRKLCRLALLGMDAEAVATASVALAEVFDAGTVDAPSYTRGFLAGQKAMREKAAASLELISSFYSTEDGDGSKSAIRGTASTIRALPIEGKEP